MKVKIRVTRSDIENGQRRSARGCPLVLAFEHATGHPGIITLDSWWPTREGEDDAWRPTQKGVSDAGYCYYLPPDVVAFCEQYDTDERVRPFSFEIELPGELIVKNVRKKEAR